jgi:hypothetical protein
MSFLIPGARRSVPRALNSTPRAACRARSRSRLTAGRWAGSQRKYAAWRARQIAYGRWAPWADAEPVREHVRRLHQAGASYRAIAETAGVSATAVCALLQGEPWKNRPAPVRIRASLASRLLAVTADGIGRGRRSAAGTRRRLQALIAIGHAPTDLAEQIGIPRGRLWRVIRGEARTVSVDMHAAVCGLYEQLWDRRPPERTGRERGAAAAARRLAARQGWPTPMALDDDRIDDPSYRPRSHWRPTSGNGAKPLRSRCAGRAVTCGQHSPARFRAAHHLMNRQKDEETVS